MYTKDKRRAKCIQQTKILSPRHHQGGGHRVQAAVRRGGRGRHAPAPPPLLQQAPAQGEEALGPDQLVQAALRRRVLPARHPQRPAQEAGQAGGGPGGGAGQDAGEAGGDLGGQHRAVAVSDGLQRVPGAAVPAVQVRPARRLAHAVLGGVPGHLQALRREWHHGSVRG